MREYGKIFRMSTEFDRAVNFLQGALDAATNEERVSAEEPETEPAIKQPLKEKRVTIPLSAAILAISCVTAIVLASACLLMSPRVVTETVQLEPDGIPLALLPDTADPDVWDVVSVMNGVINGTPVQFVRGIAETENETFKVCLDFCRSGEDIYAKVCGKKDWVVKVAPDGTIQKAYPSRANAKPLKELFAK